MPNPTFSTPSPKSHSLQFWMQRSNELSRRNTVLQEEIRHLQKLTFLYLQTVSELETVIRNHLVKTVKSDDPILQVNITRLLADSGLYEGN